MFTRTLRLALASLIAITGAAVTAPAANAEVDVYTEEGPHFVNGREWRTTCEPYSRTERCRTEIKANTIVRGKDRWGQPTFTHRYDWAFNNLTYLPAPRALWNTNPLANTTSWTASDGRQWRTECDTDLTGRNGCRSFAMVDVVRQVGRGYTWQKEWVFNNMVRFTDGPPAAPVAPPSTPAPVPTPDPTPTDEVTFAGRGLTECVRSATGHDLITRAEVEALTVLRCPAGVNGSEGIEALVNLEILEIQNSGWPAGFPELQIDVAPISKLPKLRILNLFGSHLTGVETLADLPALDRLLIGGQRAPLSNFDTSLIAHLDLEVLFLGYADLDDAAFVADHPNLTRLALDGNNITDVAPFTTLENLEYLSLRNNPITDWSPLDAMVAGGLELIK